MTSMLPHDSPHASGGAFVVAASSEVLASTPELPLSRDEFARWLALEHWGDRLDFQAARVLTKILLSFVAGKAVSNIRIRQSCEECGGPHGRPITEVPQGYEISWAHHDGIVAAAVAQQAIGIDVISRSVVAESSMRLVDEKALCQAEALFKAGAGTSSELLQLDGCKQRSKTYLDRANRRLRLFNHSTPDLEVCVASSCVVQPLDLQLLV